MFQFVSASFNVGSHSETYYFNFLLTQPACDQQELFLSSPKNCAGVHKLMFYVANRTFHENSFLFPSTTFFGAVDVVIAEHKE